MTLRGTRIGVSIIAGCALFAAMASPLTSAQASPGETRNTAISTAPETSETVFLSNVTSMNDMNDVQTALRNNFPRTHVYGVAGQLAITIRGTSEDMQAAKKMVAELDRPKKIYRVTYNLSDVENGRKTATQHYSVVVAAGGKTVLRHGKRVPLITGMSGEAANASQSSQVQYIDIGLNIEASIEGTALRTKVEQSAVTDEKSGVAAPDPVISQTLLEGTSALAGNKPVVLGSIDVPGTTRRQEIEVVADLISQ